MSSVSKAQRRAAGAAEHMSEEELKHAGPAVKQMASSMSKGQLHDFAVGSEKGKPEHVHPKKHRGDGRSSGRDKHPRGQYSK